MLYKSCDQIDFTSAGNTLRLLSQGDYLTSQVSKVLSVETQRSPLVNAVWAYHRARGNAEFVLSWSSLLAFREPSEAKRMLMEYVNNLVASRDGDLTWTTAFYGATPSSVTRWDATLINVSDAILEPSQNPRVAGLFKGESSWASIAYEFVITKPR